MASIDKTYTDSYEEYKQFKDWADKQVLTFYNGHNVCIGNYIWTLVKEDFLNGKMPIMNTATWLDVYLIQNCKSQFVLNRMKEVYGEDEYNKFKTIDLTARPSDDFQQNRKIIIRKTHRSKFPLHNKPYGKNAKWHLWCQENFWYDEDSKIWSTFDSFYPYNTNTADITSIKALVRHLRKQYLPKDITFIISGNYVGEDYLVYIS